MSPFQKTAWLCVAAEIIVFMVFYRFTRVALPSVALSIFLIGPVSIWIGPPLFRYFTRQQDKSK